MRISGRNAAKMRHGIESARRDPSTPVPGNGLDRQAFNHTLTRNYLRAVEKRNEAIQEMARLTRLLADSFDTAIRKGWD